ncbi:hypothetical protein [Methanobacterium sp. SMA-27]|uniref:hypothetical protein n=1 Tax=Methanobacterium sp. SMA-27 TaxID=1495336 RepID=UPI0018CF6410|nr:hypothetical protein [Methanobacterium sp. SMA-27]
MQFRISKGTMGNIPNVNRFTTGHYNVFRFTSAHETELVHEIGVQECVGGKKWQSLMIRSTCTTTEEILLKNKSR